MCVTGVTVHVRWGGGGAQCYMALLHDNYIPQALKSDKCKYHSSMLIALVSSNPKLIQVHTGVKRTRIFK